MPVHVLTSGISGGGNWAESCGFVARLFLSKRNLINCGLSGNVERDLFALRLLACWSAGLLAYWLAGLLLFLLFEITH